ncbi:NAD-specific glutamate dehydrogenase [Pseudomonas sp. IT-232MI5]
MAREFAGCLHLGPHRAGGETEAFEFVRVRFGNGFLRRLAVIDERRVDVGGDHQQVGFQLLGEQRRAQVLVDHRLNTLEITVLVIHGWNPAATGANHDAALVQQPLDRADFEDAFWPRTGDHAAEFVAIRSNRPAFFSSEFFRFGLVVDRADRFGRVLEGRILGVDFNLGQQGGKRHFEIEQVAQFLFDDVADHAFGFGTEHVQRVRADGGVGRRLQRQQADLRAIAVGDDQLVAGMDLGDLLGGDADVGALIVSGHRFTTAEQGVTAQSYDDTHNAILSEFDDPVGAAEGCDLLTLFLKIQIKRSQPSAAPTGQWLIRKSRSAVTDQPGSRPESP